MSALLVIALFVLGVIIALVMGPNKSPVPAKSTRQVRENTKLDSVDHMFLYGEVSGDEFYRM
jgi:hypothetical protein